MKIIIYTNILTPYRKMYYDALYEECLRNGDSFNVILMAETEPNRNWKYDEYKADYTMLLKGKCISVSGAFIHINFGLRKVITRLKPDIVICAGSYLCPGIWQILKYKRSDKYETYYWSESHLNEERTYGNIKNTVREIIRKKVYKSFDGFWFAGKLSKEFISCYADKDAKYYYQPNLVDGDTYEKAYYMDAERKKRLRDEQGIPENNIVFFTPARLTKAKGIDKMLPILGKVPAAKSITYIIAGDGEMEDELIKMSKNIPCDVRFLGYVDQKTTVSYYGLADVFLLPSISDPNPLTCIEAMWAGLPLVISNHCGNYPEVVQNGKNGFVFSYDNIDFIIEKIEYIMRNNKWRQEAAEISHNLATKCFQVNQSAYKMIEYYHNSMSH